MNGRILKISAGVAMAILIVAAGIYAKTVPEVIALKEPAYEEHKKGIVEFSHGKHQNEYAKEYPELYQNGCGECHHDENNKPLAGLKEGDDVQRCIECHKKPGEVPRKLKRQWRKEKLSRAEKKKMELEYHAEALHDNCRECHKKFNRKHRPEKKAPTTCTKCHPRTKK